MLRESIDNQEILHYYDFVLKHSLIYVQGGDKMIAKTIAKYIKEKGIKQVFLCEKTGLTKHCVSMLLKGQRKLSIDEYEKICTALNVPYDYFFNQLEKSA